MEERTDIDLPLSRRSMLQGAAGLGAASLLSDPVAAGSPGGGGSGGDGGGSGGDGDGGSADDGTASKTVTLITGETVRVHGTDEEDAERRRYTVDADEPRSYRQFQVDGDTYIVPRGVDVSRFSQQLFNVDFLIEHGLNDEETDVVPVILESARDVGAASVEYDGYSHRRTLASINAMAGDVDKATCAETSRQLAADDACARIYLDGPVRASLDEGAPAINAGAARDEFGVDGSGVDIAVLDTGIDADHPDFGDRVTDRTDFSGDGLGDRDGHGTHVAGIAAGDGSESDGKYVGIAPGANLLDVKVLDDNGFGAFSDVIAGIEYAVDNGADVINMSLGGPPQEDDPLAAATNQAADDGVLPVAAAGNEFFAEFGTIESPGTAEGATTVGATVPDNGLSFFTAKGPSPFEQNVKPEVVAPGDGITAAGSEDAGEYPYTEKSGTSMSAPMVAGLAALLVEEGSITSPADLEDAMVSTADRLDGENAFTAGGGEVNAAAALGSDLRVHNSVVDFGLFAEPATKSETVTLENTGSSAVDVDVTAELRSYEFSRGAGDPINDQVSVSPGSVTIDAGSTETVELTVEGADSFGYNAGYLTFETESETRQAIFGYVRGLQVEVEKVPHPDSNGVEFDSFLAYAHDLSAFKVSFAAFDDEGKYSFVLLDDGGKYTFYSDGNLAPGPDQPFFGPATWTVAEVEISPDNTSFTMDESATVPRVLDTSQIADLGPFETNGFSATLYALYDAGSVSANQSYTGPFNIDTLYVTPVDEDDPTNVSTTYLFSTENPEREFELDSPNVFHLFYGTTSIEPPESVVTVEPDSLAEEHFRYHRTYENQLWGVSPIRFPADLETFPLGFTVGVLRGISDDRVEQTWYRNSQTIYDEEWFDDNDIFFGKYQMRRTNGGFFGEPFNPQPGQTFDQPFNREPLSDILTKWDLSDGTLDVRGQWYADNAELPFTAYKEYIFTDPPAGADNDWSITVDGEEVLSYTSPSFFFLDPVVEGIPSGSDVGLSMEGDLLKGTSRESTTDSTWDVTYQPGTANTPPQFDEIDVRGLSTLNDVPAGQSIVFVDVDYEAESLESVRLWYAGTPHVDSSPFEDPSGWAAATTRYAEDGLYGLLINTAGYAGTVDLAVEAVDSAGNRVRKTTTAAMTIAEGADLGAPTTLQTNNVNKRSARTIPVEISGTGAFDARSIVGDSLRLGDPLTVHDGGGAAPSRTKVLGKGTLQAQFPVEGTAFDCDSPVAAQLAGELADGTTISGADVLDRVTCPQQKGRAQLANSVSLDP